MSDDHDEESPEYDGSDDELQDPLGLSSILPMSILDALRKSFGGAQPDREALCRRIKARYGIERDELDALYPKDEDLISFYVETLLKSKELVAEEDDDMPEDNYKMTERNKADVDEIELQTKREAKNKDAKFVKGMKNALPKPTDPKAKEAFEKAGEHLAPEDRMSFEDMLNTLDLPDDDDET